MALVAKTAPRRIQKSQILHNQRDPQLRHTEYIQIFGISRTKSSHSGGCTGPGGESGGFPGHKPGESGAFGSAFVKKILGRPCRAWEFIGRGDPGRWPGLVWNAPLALAAPRGALPRWDDCTGSWVTT